jgi:hypothetical protein
MLQGLYLTEQERATLRATVKSGGNCLAGCFAWLLLQFHRICVQHSPSGKLSLDRCHPDGEVG